VSISHRPNTQINNRERIQAVQGGFVVLKPNASHYEMFQNLIREGNYVKGRGEGSGWGVSNSVSELAVFTKVS